MKRLSGYMVLAIFLTLLSVAACLEGTTHPDGRIDGVWGGEHVELVATQSGAVLDYDCAQGTIDKMPVPDANGEFVVEGTYTRESGGPTHVGDRPDIHPARYAGRLFGNSLVLTVTLTDSGDVIGSYTLVQGERGRVYKCL